MEDELDQFLYGEAGEQGKPAKTESSSAEGADDAADVDMDAGSDGSDEEESDDELEIVLDDSGNDIVEGTGTKANEKREAIQLKPTTDGADGETQETVKEATMDEVLPLKGHININGIGEVEGRQILEIDLDGIPDKPWRQPGADITDYFNYGFNENSWRAYCIKQKQLREDAGLLKVRPPPTTDSVMVPDINNMPGAYGNQRQQQQSSDHGRGSRGGRDGGSVRDERRPRDSRYGGGRARSRSRSPGRSRSRDSRRYREASPGRRYDDRRPSSRNSRDRGRY